MGKQTFIEINGKKYDAVTGKLLTHASESSAPQVVHPTSKPGAVDGVQKAAKKTARVGAVKHATKQPQKSQTLMRKSVKKPDQLKKVPKQNHVDLKKKLGTSPRRAHNASTVQRSPHIQKYEQPQSRSSVVKKVAPVAVVKQTAHSNPKAQPRSATQHTDTNKPRSAAAEKLIEAALANAESHNEPPVQHKRKRKSKFARKLGISTKTAAMSSAVLAGVLLGGFFAVQNVPNLAMRVAAARAGFDATMPGYSPSGFSFNGPINYSSGQVTVSFRSNTDDRSYDVVQRSSSWNSDALLANFITAEDKQYQTYLDKGRTLYIYDGSNATWVDDGIWYQIEGESAMTTDQLIRIASSI